MGQKQKVSKENRLSTQKQNMAFLIWNASRVWSCVDCNDGVDSQDPASYDSTKMVKKFIKWVLASLKRK